MNWIVNRPIPTPSHVNVWEEFQSNFTQDWQDVNVQTNAATQLSKLKMEGKDIDKYITAFSALARKAHYPLDSDAVQDMFKLGLTFGLHCAVKMSDTRTHN